LFDIDHVTVEPLNGLHDLTRFRCSKAPIQAFCHDKLLEAHDEFRLRAAVALHEDDPRIVGYYFLCLSSIAPEGVGRAVEGGFLHVDAIPTVYMGMIGVEARLERRGIGKKLMTHALARVARIAESAGTFALTLDALDEEVAGYYEGQFDFERFEPGGLKMYLPIGTIMALGL